MPQKNEKITVDDIVIKYENGQHLFIQAKKNQPKYEKWTISDLRIELLKARNQLRQHELYKVEFYDLIQFQINSVRGIAAEAASHLYNKFLDNNIEPTENLYKIILKFSKDPIDSVRSALLYHLPFLTSKQEEKGWKLFENIFNRKQTHLWKLAERQLYYQFTQNQKLVEYYLDRIKDEAIVIAGGVWGRIKSLMLLTNNITEKTFYKQIENIESHKVWKGIAQVFTAHLDKNNYYDVCNRGIQFILNNKIIDKTVIFEIEQSFNPASKQKIVAKEIAVAYLTAIEPSSNVFDLRNFYNWLELFSQIMPEEAIDITEILAEKLDILDDYINFRYTEPLIGVLSRILKEADLSGNENLIKRVINIQDIFLKLNIKGINEYFNQLSRF